MCIWRNIKEKSCKLRTKITSKAWLFQFPVSLLMIAGNLPGVAQETCDVVDIASSNASYNGKTLTLSGSVALEHSLGLLTANHATLYEHSQKKSGKSPSFNRIAISGDVVINAHDGAQLTCALLIIDSEAMSADCSGDESQEFVTYTEGNANKSSSIGVGKLSIKSRSMKTNFLKDKANTSHSHTHINKITALDNVLIEYDKFISASSDIGVFDRLQPEMKGNDVKGLPGRITLTMNTPENLCRTFTAKGDQIESPQIEIDTLQRTVQFIKPRGQICSAAQPSQEPLLFSADLLFWDLHNNKLQLDGNIHSTLPRGNFVQADKQMIITLKNADQKHQIQAIETEGYTLLKNQEKESETFHELTCYGKVHMDLDKQRTVMRSPRDAQGNVEKADQVFFNDSVGEMRADDVMISYLLIDGKATPAKLRAKGHVRLLDRKACAEQGALHFALSDSLDYDFSTQEAHFNAASGKRVLFYDRVNNLQVSAPQLKIKRDGTSNKESIQGYGDVRFSFKKSEFEQLMQEIQPGT